MTIGLRWKSVRNNKRAVGPEKGGLQLAVSVHGSVSSTGIDSFARLLAVALVAGAPYYLRLRVGNARLAWSMAALLRAYETDRKDDVMTREQRKQLRHGALYIGLLVMICLLLIAGLTA